MAPSNSLGRHDGASRVGPPENTIPESELETERVNSIAVSWLNHKAGRDRHRSRGFRRCLSEELVAYRCQVLLIT